MATKVQRCRVQLDGVPLGGLARQSHLHIDRWRAKQQPSTSPITPLLEVGAVSFCRSLHFANVQPLVLGRERFALLPTA